MALSKRVQWHIYAVCFVALAIGVLASEPAQVLIEAELPNRSGADIDSEATS
jgi:hypothetical protein